MMLSHEDLVGNALKYISDRRKEDPAVSIDSLLDDASMRFNLSPRDRDSLERAYRSVKNGASC